MSEKSQIEELRVVSFTIKSEETEINEITSLQIGSKTIMSSINLGFMNHNNEIIPIVIKTSKLEEKSIISFENHLNTLKKIKNKNILNLYDWNLENNELKLFMKYFNKGDLENYINLSQNKASDLSERQIIDIFLRICKAIKYLHSEKYISHRDIKPLNVLMDFRDIVLIDFETCTKKTDALTRYGTTHYMAPEIFSSDIEYKPKLADIFSLGVTLFYMFFPGLTYEKAKDKCYPWQNVLNFDDQQEKKVSKLGNEIKEKEKMKDYDFFPSKNIRNISSEIMKLIRNMIKYEPEERITLDKIITICDDFLEHEKTIISIVYPIQKEPKLILHKDFKLKGKIKDSKIIIELLQKEKNTFYESLIYQRFFFEISFARFIIQQVKNLIILKDIFYEKNNKKLWKEGIFYLLCRGYIHLFYFFQIFRKKVKNSNNFFNENKKVLENLSENSEEYKFIKNIFEQDLKIIEKKITIIEKKIKCLNLIDVKNPIFLIEFQNKMIKIIQNLHDDKYSNKAKKNKIKNFIKFISDILFYTNDFSKTNDIINIEKYVEDVEKCEEDFKFSKFLKNFKIIE